MEKNKLKILLIVLITIFVFVMVSIIGLIIWYNTNLKPVSKNEAANEENFIRIEIEEGMGITQIAEILENNNIIKNAKVMKIYAKINKLEPLQAGKYELNNTEDMATILEHIVNGEVVTDEIKITFIEGKNIRWIAKTIAEKTSNTEDDVFNLLKDEEYIDSLIEKYWFLTDEIKDGDIYYPLEGYLLPDTYVFENKDVSVKTIFNVILNYMDKFLSDYEEQLPNNLTIHQMLTMASMAELEGKTEEDRQEIIGVFFNRIYDGMSLGSDVTTYYAFKVDMGERDLTVKELNTENPYNTRGPNMSGKIPIGPICNPSKSAIRATINYKETDAYYFVADKAGKVYFTKNIDEHNKMIQTLKSEGLWFTYE